MRCAAFRGGAVAFGELCVDWHLVFSVAQLTVALRTGSDQRNPTS